MELFRNKKFLILIIGCILLGVLTGVILYQNTANHPLVGKWKLVSLDNLYVEEGDESYLTFSRNGEMKMLEDSLHYEIIEEGVFNMLGGEEPIKCEYVIYGEVLFMKTYYPGTDGVESSWRKKN